MVTPATSCCATAGYPSATVPGANSFADTSKIGVGECLGWHPTCCWSPVVAARGDADDGSDLDLLVDIEPGRSLFDLGEFAFDVQDLLGVVTQVVTEAGLRGRIRNRVLAETVAV